MVSSFISLRRAPKCRPDRNRTAIGKHYWARARFRCRPVVAHASDWDAVWCKKAKSRSVRRIAISKDAWAIAMHSFISPRLLWSPLARWPDSFARQKISATNLLALPFGAPKKTETNGIGADHGRFSLQCARSCSVYRQRQFEHRRHLRGQTYLSRRYDAGADGRGHI